MLKMKSHQVEKKVVSLNISMVINFDKIAISYLAFF
jgi:hypothetical protein